MIWWPLCLKSLPRRTLTFGLFVATFVFIPQVDSVPSAALISLVMLSTIVNVVCFYGAMKFPLRLIVSYFPGKSLPLRSGRWRKLTNVPFSVHFLEPRVVAPDRRFFWPPCVRPQRVFSPARRVCSPRKPASRLPSSPSWTSSLETSRAGQTSTQTSVEGSQSCTLLSFPGSPHWSRPLFIGSTSL